jgi:hypothetical protein
MKKFRLWIISLLLFLFVTFVITQYTDSQRSIQFTQQFVVYVLVLCGILIPILFPVIQKLPLIVFPLSLISAYLLLCAVFNTNLVIGLDHGLQMIVAGALIFFSGLLGIGFIRWVSTNNLIPQDINFPIELENSHEFDQDDIKDEFYKTKASNRSIALIVLQPVLPDEKINSANNIILKEKHWLMYKTIKEVITRGSRQTDLTLGHTQEKFFLLVCPETNQIGAERLVNRIHDSVQKQLEINLQYGIAIYPDDSSTYEELQRIAESRLGKY